MAYTDKTTIEGYLNTSGLNATVCSMVISAVSNFIDKFCGGDVVSKRKFEAPSPDNDETRVYDGNGSHRLVIDDLVSITSLSVDGVLIDSSGYKLYPANETPKTYIELLQPNIGAGNFNSRSALHSAYVFNEGQQNVSIVGKFRYSNSVPDEVKLAATQLCAAVFRETSTKDAVSESLGDYSISYAKISEIANRVGATDLLKPLVRQPLQQVKTGVIKIS